MHIFVWKLNVLCNICLYNDIYVYKMYLLFHWYMQHISLIQFAYFINTCSIFRQFIQQISLIHAGYFIIHPNFIIYKHISLYMQQNSLYIQRMTLDKGATLYTQHNSYLQMFHHSYTINFITFGKYSNIHATIFH